MQVIFGMGRSCLSLADQCIDAFERWIIMDKFVREDIEVLVKSLYPVWQTYFVSAGKITRSSKLHIFRTLSDTSLDPDDVFPSVATIN
jgi:hypothetical protein